jgi:hypothetical protein
LLSPTTAVAKVTTTTVAVVVKMISYKSDDSFDVDDVAMNAFDLIY